MTLSRVGIIPLCRPRTGRPAPALVRPYAWRVWVEWWGQRQALERDLEDHREAREWYALIEATEPTAAELLGCGFGWGGVASHGGAAQPKDAHE